MENEKKIKKLKWFMIIFNGLGADLLFYIAINTLFFTTVKGLSAADISLVFTFSSLFALVLYFPISVLIKKIRNQYSVILKCLLFLIASLLFTFGESILVFIIGGTLYQLAGIAGQVSYVILKNNLEAIGEGEKYVDMRSKCKLFYSIITCVIAIGAGYLFAYNSYLPMYLCIFFSLLVFVLSFFYKDILATKPLEEAKPAAPTKSLLCLATILIIGAAIFVSQNLITTQEYSRLALQFTFEGAAFSTAEIAIILGYIIIGCRITRILACVIMPKLYEKAKNKTLFMVLIPIIFGITTIGAGVGLFVDMHYIIKIALLILNFYTIYALMDIFGSIIEEFILKTFTEDAKKSVMTLMKAANMAGNFLLSLLALLILNSLSMAYLFITFGIIGILGLYFVLRLYKEKEA